jgi:hypothetical protein
LIDEVLERDCAAGEDALLVAGRDRLLGHASEHLLTAIFPVDVNAARRTFEELVPNGVVYSPHEPVPPALAALSGSELRAVLRDAVSFARDLRIARPQSSFDVTALCAGGELRLIFLAQPDVGRAARSRWRRHVTRLNVRAAIGGERAGTQRRRVELPAFLRT